MFLMKLCPLSPTADESFCIRLNLFVVCDQGLIQTGSKCQPSEHHVFSRLQFLPLILFKMQNT